MPDSQSHPTVSEDKLKGIVRTNLDSPSPTSAQLSRRKKSIEIVKEMGLPYIEHLPVIEDDEEVSMRVSSEVAKRHVAVVLCAVKGETQGNDQ